MPTWFRGLSYVMAALLFVCVALQYNDPDPIRWMAIYGAGAIVSVVLPSRRAVATVAIVLGVATAVWAGALVLEVWDKIELSDLKDKMSEKGGAVEVGREAGGLGIQAVWLVIGGVVRRRWS